MPWKPKQKKLTVEEAIALARHELTPLWFGSPPLLAGVRSGTRATAHPLDSSFAGFNWIMLFLNPTTFSGEDAIVQFREWFRRYGTHDLKFLLCLAFPYADIYTRATIEEHLLQPNEIAFPVFIDPDGSLSAAFGADIGSPKFLFLKKGKVEFESSGPDWIEKGEMRIQNFLRSSDPGLPLLPSMKPQRSLDQGSIEFGESKAEAFLSKLKFLDKNEAPPSNPSPGLIYLTGDWSREAQRILTADPSASITFISPTPRVGLIAKSIQKTIEAGSIVVQINGLPVFEDFHGGQLTRDDENNTVIEVSARWLYEVSKGLPETDRLFTLRFPEAHQIPVSLYGLRFGTEAETVGPF